MCSVSEKRVFMLIVHSTNQVAHALYKAITLPSKCKSSLECRRLLAADAADPVESLCVRHLRALTESSCCKVQGALREKERAGLGVEIASEAARIAQRACTSERCCDTPLADARRARRRLFDRYP